MKNFKLLHVSVLLAAFTVTATRGALTENQNIASEVTNNPDVKMAETSIETQKAIDTKVSEQPVQPVVQPNNATDIAVSTEAQEMGQPKSEVVFEAVSNDNLPTSTSTAAQMDTKVPELSTLTTQTTTQTTQEIKPEQPVPIIDESQKTFAQEAEEKAEEKAADESAVIPNEPQKVEAGVSEEEMVFVPEKSQTEQNIIEKTEQENKTEGAAKEVLAEENKKAEKSLEDMGLNKSYIEEEDTESLEDKEVEPEMEVEAEATNLIG